MLLYYRILVVVQIFSISSIQDFGHDAWQCEAAVQGVKHIRKSCRSLFDSYGDNGLSERRSRTALLPAQFPRP